VVRAALVFAAPWRPDFSMITRFAMARQTVLSRKLKKKGKKRGPPATGKGTLIGVRLQPLELARLDYWIAAQEDSPSRPEAIRRHLVRSLAAEPKPAKDLP